MEDYKKYQNEYWDDLSELEEFRSVLDPNDDDGKKNDRINHTHQEIISEAFKKIELPDNPTIIDYGCGVGRNYPFLKNLSGTYFGYDQSKKMLEKARENHAEGTFQWVEDNKWDTDQTADIFFSFWVFQHVIEDDDLLKIFTGAFSTLSERGYLIFCERSATRVHETGKDPFYIRHRSPRQYIKLAKSVGFKKKWIKALNYQSKRRTPSLFTYNANGENIYVFQKG